MSNPKIIIPDMCAKHQSLLVHQCGVPQEGPWRALIMAAQIVLFQGSTAKKQLHEVTGGDITKVTTVGCLGCYSPDVFGEVVAAFQEGGFASVKALGDRYCDGGIK